MDNPISQTDVDAVAHYTEAAQDLRNSPFFIEEYIQLSLTWTTGSDGKPILVKATFPDPYVRDSMLVAFRRVWLSKEPSHFYRVAKILKRYVPHRRSFVDWCVRDAKKASMGFDPMTTAPGDNPHIPPRDIIDLWLNTKLMHVGGKTGRTTRFTRADFDEAAQRIGEVRLEYLFLSAVFRLGLPFINLLQLTEVALKTWALDGLQPSFRLELSGSEDSSGAVPVSRSTPGISIDRDTPSARLGRLRRRRAYAGMDALFSLFRYDNEDLVYFVEHAENVDALIAAMGATMSDAASFHDFNDADQCVSMLDDHATVARNMKCRRGFLARFGSGRLLAREDVRPILNDQLAKMRELLFAQAV